MKDGEKPGSRTLSPLGAEAPSSRRPSRPAPLVASERPIVSFVADEVALSHANTRAAANLTCDVCDAEVLAEDAHGGLFVWSRHGETVIDEPPVCESCGSVLSISLLRGLLIRGEEEG